MPRCEIMFALWDHFLRFAYEVHLVVGDLMVMSQIDQELQHALVTVKFIYAIIMRITRTM